MKINFVSLCSGCGGIDLGLEKAGFKCVGQVEIIPYALKILKKHWPKVPKHTDILTLLRSASLVKIYLKPTRKEKVLTAKKVLSSLSVCGLSTSLIRLGYSLRMFPDSFPLTTEEIWQQSFKHWPKAGMGGLIDYWTLNTSESPNDAVECSLSDVLEEFPHPKYYLSKKAVAGMIRRSQKWGRGGYVFLLKTEKDKTRQLKLLSLPRLERMIITGQTQEQKEIMSHQRSDKAKIPTPITERISSPRQSGKVRNSIPQWEAEAETSLFPQFRQRIKNSANSVLEKISSGKQSGQPREGTLPLYGKTLILRKLTPEEKETLQGFPKGWTLVEE